MLARKLGVSPVYLETGSEVDPAEERELRLAAAELVLRLSDDPSGVERDLRGLVEESIQAGDLAAAARGETTLGLVAFGEGDVPATIELLERALTRTDPSPSAQPDLYATLGRAYSMHGEPDKAVALFRGCLERLAAEEPDNTVAYIRFATYLSYALSDQNDIPGAQAAVRDALARVSEGSRSLHARAPVLGAGAPGRGARARARGARQRAARDRAARGDRGHAPPGPGAPALREHPHASGRRSRPGARTARAGRGALRPARRVGRPRPPAHRAGTARRLHGRERGPRSPSPTRRSSCSVTATLRTGARRGGRSERPRPTRAASTRRTRRSPAPRTSSTSRATLRERIELHSTWGRALRKAGREAEALDVLERAADLAVQTGHAEARSER